MAKQKGITLGALIDKLIKGDPTFFTKGDKPLVGRIREALGARGGAFKPSAIAKALVNAHSHQKLRSFCDQRGALLPSVTAATLLKAWSAEMVPPEERKARAARGSRSTRRTATWSGVTARQQPRPASEPTVAAPASPASTAESPQPSRRPRTRSTGAPVYTEVLPPVEELTKMLELHLWLTPLHRITAENVVDELMSVLGLKLKASRAQVERVLDAWAKDDRFKVFCEGKRYRTVVLLKPSRSSTEVRDRCELYPHIVRGRTWPPPRR